MVTKIFNCSIVFMLLACGGAPEPGKQTEDKESTEIQPVQTPVETPFKKEVAYKQIKFIVTSPGKSGGNSYTINPSGYTVVNSPVTQDIFGKVSDVLADDIDGDDNPELAVLVRSEIGDSVTAFIYSSNGNKSMSNVNLPVIGKEDKSLSGYKGHDEYNFVEGSFIRRFPLYENDSATGKMRQFQYKLKAGEALKQLVLYKSVEY